jgi:hypothetical protein
MRHILVLITLSDGRQAVLSGLFPSEWAAIDMGMQSFEDGVAFVPRVQGVC